MHPMLERVVRARRPALRCEIGVDRQVGRGGSTMRQPSTASRAGTFPQSWRGAQLLPHGALEEMPQTEWLARVDGERMIHIL